MYNIQIKYIVACHLRFKILVQVHNKRVENNWVQSMYETLKKIKPNEIIPTLVTIYRVKRAFISFSKVKEREKDIY